MSEPAVASAGRVASGRDAADTATLGAGRVASAGVDDWDVSAQLESRGVSQSVARSLGYDSVFEYARTLRGQHERAIVPAHTRRGRISVAAAWLRSLVMAAGVALCVTSVPAGASEIVVFALAASGWLAGQAVSAAVWHAWGVSDDRRVGLRLGLAVSALVVMVGCGLWALLGVWDGLVWVGWCAAIPLLLLVVPPGLLLGTVVGVSALCVVSWAARAGYAWAPAVLGGVGVPASFAAAAAALLAVAVATPRAARGWRPRYRPGTALAIGAATVQTVAQLALLLTLFIGLGPAAFGPIAVAGLLMGLLADPLYTASQARTRAIAERATAWRAARASIAVPWVASTLVLLAVGAAVIVLALSDPYQIFLNERTVVAGAVLAGAVIAGTNVLLRSGSVIGAAVFALVAELLAVPTMAWPSEDAAGLAAMAAVAAVMAVAALALAARRFAQPTTW